MHGAIPSNSAPARNQPLPSIATASTPVDKPTTPYVCSVPSRNRGYTVPYCGSREEDQRSGANREQNVAAQRIHEQRKRLKRQHPLHAADDKRQRHLGHARAQRQRENLVQAVHNRV